MKKINYKYYLGNIEQAYLGYSLDENIRLGAASGGIVSAILINLLKEKKIDGALVCRQKMVSGKIGSKVYIAKTPKEILDSRTSIYFFTPVLTKIQEIKNFPGKLAIVALPCQIKALKQLFNTREFAGKFLFIGLFCGHTSKKELLLKVLEKKKIPEDATRKVIFRKGHWRGKMHIILKNKSEAIFPFQHFSTYQNLFFYCERQCLACTDHCNEAANISCGDVWSLKYKSNPIKHSLILARNKKSRDLLEVMRNKKILNLNRITPKDVFDIQKRSLVFHRHIKARSLIGKLFGYRIKCSGKEEARWNDYPAAFIALLCSRLSESKTGGKLVFALPRQIWSVCLYFFKFLTSF